MAEEPPPHFVQLSSDGRRFEIDGSPWYFAGCNCYYLMTRAASVELRHEVLEVLDAAVSCGLTAVRTWAFCEGDEWNSLQPKAGLFDERVFQGLDWVLAEAGKRNLKVMLVLVNYWSAYGGMPQYVRWSCERRGVKLDDDANAFYADPLCQDVFHNFLATIVARTNTVTGVTYRDDPTIMAWGLANEARCVGDFSGSILQNWAASTSEFLKSLDPHHLLTLGTEGFLGGMTPGLLPDNPYDCLNQGCDFVRNHSIPNLDFCTIHLWPDSWLKCGEEQKLNFCRRWINCHVDCCCELGKPLVIAEFGKKPAGPERAAFYEKVYKMLGDIAKAEEGVVGSFFWSAVGSSIPDYDGFSVYMVPPKLKADVCSQRRDPFSEASISAPSEADAPKAEWHEAGNNSEQPERLESDSRVNQNKSGKSTADLVTNERDDCIGREFERGESFTEQPQQPEDETAGIAGWKDSDVVSIIKAHANEMRYLTTGYCNFM